MSSKLLLLMLLLLFFSLIHARPLKPGSSSNPNPNSVTTRLQGGGDEVGEEDVRCEGSMSEEECLERRTLVAHTDYIYTQSQNP